MRAHRETESSRSATESPGTETFYQRLVHELKPGRYVDVTKETQFSDAWMALAVLLALAGLAIANDVLLAGALMLAVIAAITWLWNEFSLYGLHYERRLSEVRAFLGETIEVTLEVRNQKFLPLPWLRIVDTVPAQLPVDGQRVATDPLSNLGEFSSFWSLGAFQRVSRHFKIECTQRGYHAYGPAQVTTGDGFGLFSRKATLQPKQQLIIYPRIYPAAELGIPARHPFGSRVAENTPFEDPLRYAGIREWQPSDSMRRVHWKATVRQQKLLSRAYEPSEEAQIVVFLNVATLPRHWQGNIPELQERAISVAGSLAALCTELRLPVGLIANGFLPGSDQPLRLAPGRSPGQLVRILELLAAVTPFATQPIEELLTHEAPKLAWGATLVVVTAVAHDDLLATLVALNKAGRRVVLFTLAEKPPPDLERMSGVVVYHLPHLVDDLIAPEIVWRGAERAALQ